MNENLKKYMDEIGKISIEEEMKRNIYLKRLADGTYQGPPVGYPHIDKPWMKYYNEEVLLDIPPKTNMTEYIKKITKPYKELIANTYYGKEFTYKNFFTNVDNCSKMLTHIGVGKKDVIAYLVPNLPQSAELWLGATQIGAISDFIDPRPDSMDIAANSKKVLEILKYEKAKYIVALDICYIAMLKPIEKQLKELGIDKIVLISATDYMTTKGQLSYLKDVISYNQLKNSRNGENISNYKTLINKLISNLNMNKEIKEATKKSPLKIYMFNDIMEKSKNGTFTKVYDENLINYIGHTSGTSGARPKPITTTNKNSISTLEQLRKGNINFAVGDKVLHVLPFFAPFGAYDNYLLNLTSGANNIIVPEFEINEFGYLLKKYKPNVIVGTPAWLSALPNYSYLQNENLSCIHTIIYGGDAMTADDEDKVNEWLKRHGSKAKLEKGHGMSEFCGCGTYAQDEYNKPASIGIPLPDTIYTIVDPNNDDELIPLRYNPNEDRIKGELVVSSGAVTNGVLNDDIIIPHYEMAGKSYIRTRDLVEMDKDGVFFHEARKDRSFTRFDGYKIKPREIETIIEQNPYVKYARLTEYYDDRQRGIMPICHLVLNEDASDEEIIEIVNDIVYNQIISSKEMSSRQIPSKFKIRKELPLTKNSKVDFNRLKNEKLTGEESNVDVTETNLSVGNIEIYRCKDKFMKIRKK